MPAYSHLLDEERDQIAVYASWQKGGVEKSYVGFSVTA